VAVPNRAYWLFRGPLAEIGTWDNAQAWPGDGDSTRRNRRSSGPPITPGALPETSVRMGPESVATRQGSTELIAEPRLDVVF
jgi:hypothetical protein